jgi:hypothetical protein
VTILVAGLIGPTTAAFTPWTDFGVGWANAGYSHDSPVAVPMNGDGNHAGQVGIASSTEPNPLRMRVRVVSTDPEPVDIDVEYLWISCKTKGGGYWQQELSNVIPTVTPPATITLYNRRIDGPVDGCHVDLEFSTGLYDDGLHNYMVKLQARYAR